MLPTFLMTVALCTPQAGQDPPIPADVAPELATASGLRYSVLVAGKEGASPTWTDMVNVHYTGWLPNGMVFDSSRGGGEPAQFRLGGVIDGWNEALQSMTPGARWKLTVPPELGYGAEGQGDIPPNSTLIFDVELLSFDAGPGLPAFRDIDESKAVESPLGYRYEVIAEGAGNPVGNEDLSLLHFTFWNAKGERIDTTLFRPEGCFKVSAAQLNLPFMKDVLPRMKPGAQVLCQVPDAASFAGQGPPEAGETTIWLVSLLNPTQPELAAVEWQKTASGLEYSIVAAGKGDKPVADGRVRAHYSGWLENGRLFDSSVGSEPIEFDVRTGRGGVIAGWVEGVQLVGAGGEVWLRVPPALAYGEQQRGPIPANSTLVFRLRLESILR